MEVELFYADGWTDMTNVVVAFRTFVNAPKNATKKITCVRFFLLGTVRDVSTDFLGNLGDFCTINSSFFKLFHVSFYRPILELFRQEVFIIKYVKKHGCHLRHAPQTRSPLDLALVTKTFLTTGLA